MESPAPPDRPRKRRAINACASCRSCKVKCDGKRPCQRCIRNDTPCQYLEVTRDENTQRIEKLEGEIELLRAQMNSMHDTVRTPEPVYTRTTSLTTVLGDSRRYNIMEVGLIDWQQASFWFQSFFSGSHYLVPIFSEPKDTASSVLSRNSFLFDAIVGIGCRAEQGLESTMFRQIQSRLREHLTNLLVNVPVPPIEAVQAIALMAAYSENGYVLVALALRFAIQLGLPDTVDELISKASTTSEIVAAENYEIYRLARVWLGICNLQLFFSLDGGHLPNITLNLSSRKIRCLAKYPAHTAVDIRLLSQVELNIIRSDAYSKIMEHNSRPRIEQNETFLETCIRDTTIELSLWSEEWTALINQEPIAQQRSLALLNLDIQLEWALITLHLKAASSSKIDNLAIMTGFQTEQVHKAKEAAKRHLRHLLEASNSPYSSVDSPSPDLVPIYLNTFKWTMDYVWAKAAFSVLLVLRLAILLRDPVQSVLSLLHDAHKVLEALKKITTGHVSYFQILQTSIEKCEAALAEHVTQRDASIGSMLIPDDPRAAEKDFQTYVPTEFVFEWDFPGLNLKHTPVGWQELFVDIDGLF